MTYIHNVHHTYMHNRIWDSYVCMCALHMEICLCISMPWWIFSWKAIFVYTFNIYLYYTTNLSYLLLSLNVYTYITISMLHLCVCLLIYICLLLFCQCYRVVWSADKRLNSPNLRFKFDFLFFFFNCFTFIVYLVINFFYYLCIIQYCF